MSRLFGIARAARLDIPALAVIVAKRRASTEIVLMTHRLPHRLARLGATEGCPSRLRQQRRFTGVGVALAQNLERSLGARPFRPRDHHCPANLFRICLNRFAGSSLVSMPRHADHLADRSMTGTRRPRVGRAGDSLSIYYKELKGTPRPVPTRDCPCSPSRCPRLRIAAFDGRSDRGEAAHAKGRRGLPTPVARGSKGIRCVHDLQSGIAIVPKDEERIAV